MESTGFSSYHALWLAARKRLSASLQFDAWYAWSKSLDTNSLNSSGFGIQDGYDIANQYGLSDFDARHRFVLSATYGLPLGSRAVARDWRVAAIVQAQSGNPVNIVTSNSTLNGLPNTVRPDVTGPIHVIGSVDQWFDPSVFVATTAFGNLGRNVVIGPGFSNTDRRSRGRSACRKAGLRVPRGRLRPLQPCQLRPARQHRRHADLRPDHEDAPAHRRSRLVAPDPAGGEIAY